MILLEMMLELVIGVMVMEVDKMADEVTDMEVYKVTDMKIPIDVTLAIGDIYGDDVRGGDGGDGTPYDIRVSLKRQNDFW